MSAAATQLSCPAMALMMTSRRVIARTSRRTHRSICSIVRRYSARRTSLNVYAPDISNVYDSSRDGGWRKSTLLTICGGYLSEALAGELVGIAEIDRDRSLVRFGEVELGTIDRTTPHMLRRAGMGTRRSRPPLHQPEKCYPCLE